MEVFMDKELIFKALNHEVCDKIPWVPFAGVHAGKLLGYDATEVLTDADKLFDSLMEVNRMYRPNGQPVIFDLQIEAEILGCNLIWAKDGPPSVSSHPLSETKKIPCRCTLPAAEDGRLPMVLDVMRRMKSAVGEDTALYGLICGPFTLASHLRGNDIFIDMYDDEEYVKELISFCTDVAKIMSDLYIDAGMDVIAIVDPLLSQISSNHFDEFIAPFVTDIFANIKSKGKYSALFVCGDATRNVECMCLTKPDCICVDENVDILAAKEITDKYNVTIGGNIPLTTIMLYGTQQDNMKYVIDLMDKLDSFKNIILAPGCDMPYDTPVANTVAVAQAIYQTESVREMIKNYVASDDDVEVELPNYGTLNKPLVEVFTLDSATCAACTYMMGAANAVKGHFVDKIDIVEYKYTVKENIARCKKMGIQHLPSVYINGQIAFSSIIPSKEEFVNRIESVMQNGLI
jgi:uroporphyrinogen decarboxylase